jgi:hypothetical protein
MRAASFVLGSVTVGIVMFGWFWIGPLFACVLDARYCP